MRHDSWQLHARSFCLNVVSLQPYALVFRYRRKPIEYRQNEKRSLGATFGFSLLDHMG